MKSKWSKPLFYACDRRFHIYTLITFPLPLHHSQLPITYETTLQDVSHIIGFCF